MVKSLVRGLFCAFVSFLFGILNGLAFLLNIVPWYQYIGFFKKAGVSRDDSLIRWNLISPHLTGDSFSFKDIGCNLGFFSFRLAEKSRGFGIGFDYDPVYVLLCNLRGFIKKNERLSFTVWRLSSPNSAALPKTQVTLFLSVFHHMVRYEGFDSALNTLEDVCDSTLDVLVFETGHGSENAKWATELPACMGVGYADWVEKTLKGFGFRSVEVVGEGTAAVSSSKRLIFLAKR